MPYAEPALASRFNETYERVGAYVTDSDHIPYFNPEDSGVIILPCEPVLLQQGSDERALMSQGPIRAGEIGMLLTRWTVDLPATISAETVVGAPIYWDFATLTAKLEGDVTNGWLVGYASFPLPSSAEKPSVDADGRVIAAVSGATTIRVVYDSVGAATTKGTVTSVIL